MWHWHGCPRQALTRSHAANMICDLDGSHPNSGIQFVSISHLSSADSSRFRFLPSNACVLSEFELPRALFQPSK